MSPLKRNFLYLPFFKISSPGLFTWKAFEIANLGYWTQWACHSKWAMVGPTYIFWVAMGPTHLLSMWCHLEWCMSHPIWAWLGLNWVCFGSTLNLDIFTSNLGQVMFDWPMIKMDQKPIKLIKLIHMIKGLIEHRIWEIWNFYSCVKLPYMKKMDLKSILASWGLLFCCFLFFHLGFILAVGSSQNFRAWWIWSWEIYESFWKIYNHYHLESASGSAAHSTISFLPRKDLQNLQHLWNINQICIIHWTINQCTTKIFIG